MKIELKPIIDQLTELIGLPNNQKVSALIDNGETLIGWTIVNVNENGIIKPTTEERFDTIKDLIESYDKRRKNT